MPRKISAAKKAEYNNTRKAVRRADARKKHKASYTKKELVVRTYRRRMRKDE